MGKTYSSNSTDNPFIKNYCLANSTLLYIHLHLENLLVSGASKESVGGKDDTVAKLYNEKLQMARENTAKEFKHLFAAQIKKTIGDAKEQEELFSFLISQPGLTIEELISKNLVDYLNQNMNSQMLRFFYSQDFSKSAAAIKQLSKMYGGNNQDKKALELNQMEVLSSLQDYFNGLEHAMIRVTKGVNAHLIHTFFKAVEGVPAQDILAAHPNSAAVKTYQTVGKKQQVIMKQIKVMISRGMAKIEDVSEIKAPEFRNFIAYLKNIDQKLDKTILSSKEKSQRSFAGFLNAVGHSTVAEQAAAIGLKVEDAYKAVVGQNMTQATRFLDNGTIEEFGGSRYQKKDIDLGGVEMIIQTGTPKDPTKESKVSVQVGVSHKLYQTIPFSHLEYKEKGAYGVELGSGGNLKEFFNNIKADQYFRYITLNILSNPLNAGFEQANLALNQLALTRQINRLIATRGGEKDFNQILMVNGELFSIAEIVNLVLTANEGVLSKSKSQIRVGSSQPLAVSFPGRKAAIDANTKRNTIKKEGKVLSGIDRRIKEVNKALDKVTVSATVRLNALLKALNP